MLNIDACIHWYKDEKPWMEHYTIYPTMGEAKTLIPDSLGPSVQLPSMDSLNEIAPSGVPESRTDYTNLLVHFYFPSSLLPNLVILQGVPSKRVLVRIQEGCFAHRPF
jgi:hypothetical protein